jgi:hypothetical protein
VKTVWDDYKGDFLTKEEASAVVEFEVDWDKTLCVEGYPSNDLDVLNAIFASILPDPDLVGSLRFLRDDNNRQQRLVNVKGGAHTWRLYVKGRLRKGIKDTSKDWIGLCDIPPLRW